jgi:hypothetical protein
MILLPPPLLLLAALPPVLLTTIISLLTTWLILLLPTIYASKPCMSLAHSTQVLFLPAGKYLLNYLGSSI